MPFDRSYPLAPSTKLRNAVEAHRPMRGLLALAPLNPELDAALSEGHASEATTLLNFTRDEQLDDGRFVRVLYTRAPVAFVSGGYYAIDLGPALAVWDLAPGQPLEAPEPPVEAV